MRIENTTEYATGQSAVDLLKEQLETEKVAVKEATSKFTASETARLAAEAKLATAVEVLKAASVWANSNKVRLP